MAAKRSVIVRTGTRFRSRIQTPSGHGHVPRYRNMIAAAGGKKTAFRHVRYRKEEYRKICWEEPWGEVICANNDWRVLEAFSAYKCRDDLMEENWTSLILSDGNYTLEGYQPIKDDWDREFSQLTAYPRFKVKSMKIKFNVISCDGYTGNYSRQSRIYVHLNALDNISAVTFAFAYSGSFDGWPANSYDVSDFAHGEEVIFNLADYGIVTPFDANLIRIHAKGESGYLIGGPEHVPYGFHYTCDYIKLCP